MVKYPQMRFAAMMLVAFSLCATAFAGARAVVQSLPEAVRPLAEVETNVVFDAGAAGDNLWRLSIELDATASNCVEVVFGTDADGDGVLGVDEGELCVGWDCGGWFWRDRRSNASFLAGGAGSRLELALRLDRGRSPTFAAGNVFSGVTAPSRFDPAWNLVRVVARGADGVAVESRVAVDALKVRVR